MAWVNSKTGAGTDMESGARTGAVIAEDGSLLMVMSWSTDRDMGMFMGMDTGSGKDSNLDMDVDAVMRMGSDLATGSVEEEQA